MRTHWWSWMVVAAALTGSGAYVAAEQLDRGLVTALDRIGGNLLGTDGFDAVLLDPPDPVELERLRIYLSEAQRHPVEIVVTSTPPDPVLEPPEPVRAFFRLTIGGPGDIKLEFDPNAGDIIPCVLPPDDLSGIAAPPPDSNSAGNWRPGLVTALGEVGANLLGAGAFDAVIAAPPEPIAPQRLRLFVSKTTRVEFVLQSPPEPVHVFFRMTVGGPEVELQLDQRAAAMRVPLQIEYADLSALVAR